MDLPINAYPKIGNKVLVALSGLNKNSKLDEGGYKYDRHYYHISDRFLSLKWSKSLIKQLLLYVSCTNSDGFIYVISEKEMAKAMTVSVRTVRYNNHLLAKAGIIEWERILSHVITVSFPHYLYDILGTESLSQTSEKEDRSTGYTRIKKDTLISLFNEQDVNVIRTTLRFFALSETQLNATDHRSELQVFFKDLTNFLPGYVGYKSKIKAIVEKVQNFFPITIIEGKDSVYNFLRERKISKPMMTKAKDALIYILNKDDYTPDEDLHTQDVWAFNVRYNLFLSRARREELLIETANVSLMKDDVESLITSFGIKPLEKALERVYTLMKKYRNAHQEMTLKEHILLNRFYENRSRGLRYITESIT